MRFPLRSLRRRHVVQQFQASSADPYRPTAKGPGTLACVDCGAVQRVGRWRWEPVPPTARRGLCPACRRSRDGFPAGEVRVRGVTDAARRLELTRLLRHSEAQAVRTHPLQQILAVTESDEGLDIATSDVHLARRLGSALHRAFHGSLEVQYLEDEPFVRVNWEPA